MNAGDDFNFKCPDCREYFDVRSSTPAFASIHHERVRVRMIYALCPECMANFSKLEGCEINKHTSRIVHNVSTDKNCLEYSVTNDVSLVAHNGFHVNAILRGIDIPYAVMDAYNKGVIDNMAFPLGGGTSDYV